MKKFLAATMIGLAFAGCSNPSNIVKPTAVPTQFETPGSVKVSVKLAAIGVDGYYSIRYSEPNTSEGDEGDFQGSLAEDQDIVLAPGDHVKLTITPEKFSKISKDHKFSCSVKEYLTNIQQEAKPPVTPKVLVEEFGSDLQSISCSWVNEPKAK